MKYLKKFESLNSKTEITNLGFLDSDILSTLVIEEDKATLYLFNYGNYSKLRYYLFEISSWNDDEKQEIIEWIDTYFMDKSVLREYSLPEINFDLISIEDTSKDQLTSLEILSKYSTDEIGKEVVKINLKINFV